MMLYTFWEHDSAFRHGHSMRLDFILLRPSVSPTLIDCEVDIRFRGRVKYSDHTPMWVTLEPPTPRTRRATNGSVFASE